MALILDRVRVDIDGDVAVVTLARADKHNGVDMPMLAAVLQAQKQLRQRRDIRAVILQGEGPSFCAGLDFKSVMSRPGSALRAASQLLLPWRNRFQRWSMDWRRLGVPVIALVHGNCFGAGIQLALGADIRIARPDAKISVMEAKWGLVPDMGGAALLRELLPIDVIKEITFTGRILDGQAAHQLGLVTHLSDDPLHAARDLIDEIRQRSPDCVAAAKYLMQDARPAGEYRALRAERLWQRRIIGRANQKIATLRNQKKPGTPYRTRRIGK